MTINRASAFRPFQPLGTRENGELEERISHSLNSGRRRELASAHAFIGDGAENTTKCRMQEIHRKLTPGGVTTRMVFGKRIAAIAAMAVVSLGLTASSRSAKSPHTTHLRLPSTPAPIRYHLRMHHLHTGEDIDIVYRIGDASIPYSRSISSTTSSATGAPTTAAASDPKEFDILHSLMPAPRPSTASSTSMLRLSHARDQQRLRSLAPVTGVAEHSQHMLAKAITTLRVPGVSTVKLRNCCPLALHARRSRLLPRLAIRPTSMLAQFAPGRLPPLARINGSVATVCSTLIATSTSTTSALWSTSMECKVSAVQRQRITGVPFTDWTNSLLIISAAFTFISGRQLAAEKRSSRKFSSFDSLLRLIRASQLKRLTLRIRNDRHPRPSSRKPQCTPHAAMFPVLPWYAHAPNAIVLERDVRILRIDTAGER